MRTGLQLALLACGLCITMRCHAQLEASPSPRTIELTADHDSRYRCGGKISPIIEVFAREPLVLRITAKKADQVARDGSIHGLALLDKDSNAVPGWRFFFHPGVQEVTVIAPSVPGIYHAVCTVICSDGHEGMGFTLVVTDVRSQAKE